ncbi:adenosine deaminase [Microbacterium sp. SA39]|uniref:adenosine deaminase n=1 Tax=Microbacterium sp. SA39 TaxID=1263625 RepID=UPI0005FA0394|nr:adenosine deaminase [Microbacterium sp. SA39]KJQ53894.1 Aminodeoxyfutalosine deaminase [Microbacterium sp. SA39]
MHDLFDESAIRTLPKVVLHDHLDGGIRVSTLIELAAAKRVALSSQDPEELQAWIVEECSGSLDQYLIVSDLMVKLLTGDAEALQRVGREFAHDLAADGIVYAEVRWAPEEMATRGLTISDALAAVTAGLDAGVAEVSAQGRQLHIEQILCAIRTGTRSLEIARLALAHRGKGVVAFDLAGAEAGHSAEDHRSALDLLKREGMPVTLHAGEADGPASIRSAVETGGAARIGHGVRIMEDIADDDQLGPTATLIRDSGIALEICPRSNMQTGASASPLVRHPFDRLQRLGFRTTVSTDNRLLSGTTLSDELFDLARVFGYAFEDIVQLQLAAAEVAFISSAERAALRMSIRAGASAIAR